MRQGNLSTSSNSTAAAQERNQDLNKFHEALSRAGGGARHFITDTRCCLCFSFIEFQGGQGPVIYRPTTWWQLGCLRRPASSGLPQPKYYSSSNQPAKPRVLHRRASHWEQQGLPESPEGSQWSVRLCIYSAPTSRLGPTVCKQTSKTNTLTLRGLVI